MRFDSGEGEGPDVSVYRFNNTDDTTLIQPLTLPWEILTAIVYKNEKKHFFLKFSKMGMRQTITLIQ